MEHILKMAPAILVLIIGIVQVGLQEKWAQCHDRRTKSHKLIVIILVASMTLLTFTTCVIVWRDNRESQILRSDIVELRSQQKAVRDGRIQKVKAIARRAYGIQAEGNFFLLTFLGVNGRSALANHFDLHYKGAKLMPLTTIAMQKELHAIFMSARMLEPTDVLTRNTSSERFKPVAQIGILTSAMRKSYTEAKELLSHYGDTDHELIRIVDELRMRSELLATMVPTLERIPGGVHGIFENGVPDQYAGFFSHYFAKQYECKLLCDSISEEDVSKKSVRATK